MAIIETQLFDPQLLENNQKVICVCPNNTTYKFTKPEVFNFSTNIQTLNIWIVPPNQTPGDINFHTIRQIAARNVTTLKELIGTTLKSQWSLVIQASENEKANIKITAKITT